MFHESVYLYLLNIVKSESSDDEFNERMAAKKSATTAADDLHKALSHTVKQVSGNDTNH